MKYRSDTDPDFQMLEHMLLNGRFGPLKFLEKNDPFHDIDLLNSLSPLAEQISGQLGIEPADIGLTSLELPTRYDNPLAFHILTALTDSLKDTCRALDWDTSEFPEHACIPTGSVNAHAVKLEKSGKQLIVFDSQIFFFCNLFSKAIASALPVEYAEERYQFSCDPEVVFQHLSTDATGVRQLGALLKAGFEEGPSSAPAWIPAKPYVAMAGMLRESMELFLVAHEYGHILHDHLGTSRMLNAVSGFADDRKHIKEYEADAIGWLLSFTAMRRKGYDIGTSYIGAALLFLGFELREKYAYFRDSGSMAGYVPTSKSTHPSNDARVAMMNRVAALFIKPPNLDRALELQKNYRAIVDFMFEIVVRRHVG